MAWIETWIYPRPTMHCGIGGVQMEKLLQGSVGNFRDGCYLGFHEAVSEGG